MLCQVEVVEDGSGGNYGAGHTVDSETFEGCRSELFAQAFVGGIEGEQPVFQLERYVAPGECFFSSRFQSALDEHFFRRHVAYDFVDIVGRAFSGEKFACAYVEECHAAYISVEVYGGQKVVFGAVEDVVVERHARRHQFDYSSLDKFFCHLRILELFADGYPFAGAYQTRQI